MKRRVLYILLPVLTLILELLPYGAVCNFAAGPGETIRRTYSYFDLVPFGYANFSPLLTAITTCVILALLAVYLFTGSHRVLPAAKGLLCIAIVLSFCPLLFGFRYISLVGICITASLIGEFALLSAASKQPGKR